MPGLMVLRVGDRVRFDGLTQTVVGLSGTLVRLADEQGLGSVVHLPYLLAADGFERLGERAAAPVLSAGSLHGVPLEVIQEAQWWERHIVEVITGRPPDAEAGALPRLGYDPVMRSLVQREQAKAAELAAQGRRVSIRTLQRKRQRYEAQGLAGLIDWRADRYRSLHGRTDTRVAEALRQAVEEATDRSTRTVAYLRWRTEQILAAGHGAGTVPMPSRATFYRLFERVQGGRHTTGSARTRQSLGNRPASPFGGVAALRPGELMQVDSTPLDVLVLLPGGMPGRGELTIAWWTWPPVPSPRQCCARRPSRWMHRCCWPAPSPRSRCARAGRMRWPCPGRCCRTGGCWIWTSGWSTRRPGR